MNAGLVGGGDVGFRLPVKVVVVQLVSGGIVVVIIVTPPFGSSR